MVQEYYYKGHDLEQELLHSIVSRILSLTYYTLLLIVSVCSVPSVRKNAYGLF